jgi:hypothetical protein
MSNDFKKVLVKDDRLMVTDSLNYAVLKGGQNVVSQVAAAITQSTSSISFNVQIPSEQTIVDRKLFIQSTVQIDFQTAAACTLVYGQNLSLAPFPIHQLCSTIQTTINNNVTSINIRDVLPFLVRSNDSRELQKSMSACPSLKDQVFFYSDGVGTAGQWAAGSVGASFPPNIPQYGNPGNVLGGFLNTIDTDIVGNGTYAGPGISNAAPTTGIQAVTLYQSQNSGATYNVQTSVESTFWRLIFTTVEPVLCQPFLWSNPVSNKQGMYGVQTIQLQYNIADASRAIRCTESFFGAAWVPGNAVTDISIPVAPAVTAVRNSNIIFKFLTPHPSDLLPARNVVPLLVYDRYFSNANNPSLSQSYTSSGIIQSNTYNLTQIPDKICIFLRKKMTTQRPTDTDGVPVITNISINFNNNAGLLSSSTIHDLYRYSVEAGSNQSFNEFCGQAYSNSPYSAGFPAVTNGVGATSQVIPTTGSYLMLDFATVVQLTEDYYAPGSLGNFQLQFQVTIQNQTTSVVAANTLELVLVVMNSGIMVTERGQTSTYTGILTKQDVLDASQQQPLSVTNVARMVGSGNLDRGRALPASIGNMINAKANPVLAQAVESSKNAMSKRLM